MALFTANKQASSFIRGQKLVIVTSFIFPLLCWCWNIYVSINNKRGSQMLLFSSPIITCLFILAFAGSAYYNFIRIPAKCNRFIQSIEYGDGRITLKTFPFKSFFPPRNLKPIEFTLEQNKLEIRRSNIWSQFSEREVFIVVHEGKKYYLAPYYFDDFEGMIHTLPFVKVEAA